MLNLVGQQKSDQTDVGSDIEEGPFVDVLSNEREAFEIRDPGVEHCRRSLTVGVGAKSETVKERDNHRSANQTLPDLPASGHEQAAQSRLAVGLILPD